MKEPVAGPEAGEKGVDPNIKELEILEMCEKLLSPRVFDEVFGASDADKQTLEIKGKNQLQSFAFPSDINMKGSQNEEVRDLRFDTKAKPSRGDHRDKKAEQSSAQDLLRAYWKKKLPIMSTPSAHSEGNVVLITNDSGSENLGVPKCPQGPSRALPLVNTTPVEVQSVNSQKLILIEPLIVISELAARLGLKPFVILADVIKLGVFRAPNQTIEREIAAKICEIHGFTVEER